LINLQDIFYILNNLDLKSKNHLTEEKKVLGILIFNGQSRYYIYL